MSSLKQFFHPRNIAGDKLSIKDIIRAPYFRLAVLTSFAGAISYWIGARTPHVSGVTAAITALVSVRHTFHGAIRESYYQVLGVVIGGTLAFSLLKFMGFNSLVVMLAIFTCFVTARYLKLGEEGAIAISITMVLVIGPTVSTTAIETRFYGVILGASLATAVSYFVHKGSPHDRALKAGIEQSFAMSALLHKISETLSESGGAVDRKTARSWLAQAEFIANEIADIKENADSALAGSHWSPIIDRQEAQAVVHQIEMTEATAGTIVNICRELVLTTGSSQQIPALLATALAGVLSATADVITDQAEVAEESPAEHAHEDQEELEEQRNLAIAKLKELDETQPMLFGGSILRDAEKITDILG